MPPRCDREVGDRSRAGLHEEGAAGTVGVEGVAVAVTVTLLVIMGSDCVSWKLPVKLMVVSALPPLMAKIAVRSDASLLTSCAQAGAAVSAVAASRAVANVVVRYAADDDG